MAQHPLLRDPVLRALALVMVLYGALVSSFGPYISLMAVQVFRLGDLGYAAMMTSITAVSVTGALGIGIWTDQHASRRRAAILSAGLLTLAMGAMTLAPVPLVFVVAHAALIPLGATLYGQVFAVARLAASVHPPEARGAIMAALRALIALPFVVALPLWSAAFASGTKVLAIYPVGLGLTSAILILILRYWPRDGATAWEDRPSGLSIGAAMRELARPEVALRVAALGAITTAGVIYMSVIALILSPAVGRGPADVALYVGLVAGGEVPVMLLLPRLAARVDRTRLIAAGATLYVTHLAGLALLAGSPFLWLMVIPAAIGGAVIIVMPIAYLQDLLGTRPGTGAALLALQRLAGDALAAGCFTLGTALSGYALVAGLGVLATLVGAGVLLWADRAR